MLAGVEDAHDLDPFHFDGVDDQIRETLRGELTNIATDPNASSKNRIVLCNSSKKCKARTCPTGP